MRTTVILLVIVAMVESRAQVFDPVLHDLHTLSGLQFCEKYSIEPDGTSFSEEDVAVTKLIWSLSDIRSVDRELRGKGTPTVTMIVSRPGGNSQYYVVGHYQARHGVFVRMSFYRIHESTRKIQFQSLDNFINDEWRPVDRN